MIRPCVALAAFLLSSVVCVPGAAAHAFLPASLDVHQVATDRYTATFRRSGADRTALTVDWPAACRASVRGSRTERGNLVDQLDVACDGPLSGRTLRVLGLSAAGTTVVLYAEVDGSRPLRALLTPERPSLLLPRRHSMVDVVRDYGGLGLAHLLAGADHVLFVAGLFLVVTAIRARLVALTAFTLGHGVTLCLAALSVVRLPAAPVEVGIALSLVWLGLEAVRGKSDESARPIRFTAIPFAFGLLHGLGFAGALSDAGLPPSAVPLSLFAFNAGIELGQLLVAAAILALVAVANRLGIAELRGKARLVTGYAIGAMAAMWCLERLAPFVARG